MNKGPTRKITSIAYQHNTWWLSDEGLNEHPGGSTSTAGIIDGFDICKTDQLSHQLSSTRDQLKMFTTLKNLKMWQWISMYSIAIEAKRRQV